MTNNIAQYQNGDSFLVFLMLLMLLLNNGDCFCGDNIFFFILLTVLIFCGCSGQNSCGCAG